MSNFNYLKKFENFSDSEYYNTLTQEEFFNIVNKNTIIDIDSNLKDIIESRLKHKSYVTIRTTSSGFPFKPTPKRIEVETFTTGVNLVSDQDLVGTNFQLPLIPMNAEIFIVSCELIKFN